MFRLDLEHTGARGTEDLLGGPELKWKFDTGGSVESSPTVVGGVVYVGTFNRALFALDADTGEIRWRFPVGGLLRASPSVVNGVVYFGPASAGKALAAAAARGGAAAGLRPAVAKAARAGRAASGT